MSWRARSYLWVTTAVVAVAFAAGTWVAVNSTDTLAALEPAPSPVAAAVQSGDTDLGEPAVLVVTPGERPPVIGGGLEGTVTSLSVEPGHPITSGQQLYRVDTVAVTAYADSQVLFRDLRLGDRGDDVRAMQRILQSALDESITIDGVFDDGTEKSVREFESEIGVSEPSGVFRRAYVVRIPSEDYVAAEVRIDVGGIAPTEGSILLTGAPAAVSASLESDITNPKGDYEFVFNGVKVPLVQEDGTWAGDLTAAVALLSPGAAAGEPARFEGRVRLLQRVPSQVVPGSAIITGADGKTCVAVVNGRSYRIVAVQVVGAETGGAAQLKPELEEQDLVLVNPQAILDSPTCRSN